MTDNILLHGDNDEASLPTASESDKPIEPLDKNILQTLGKTMRLPFLTLTPVCIFLGVCTALTATTAIHTQDLILVLLGALAAHISVNTFNEYLDFKSGLDAVTTRTPFSGGSGALVADPAAMNRVLYLAIATLAITAAIGCYFIISSGLLLLPLGGIGILIILTYTQWLNRRPWLCLIAPGLAFGPLMVLGTHFVLTGKYSGTAFLVSLVPFFLINNLLLLNQYPDIHADRSVGRKTFPIVYGIRKSSIVYGVFVSLTCATLIFGLQQQMLPLLSSVCLITLTTTPIVLFGSARQAYSIEKLTPFLALNVAIAILTPLLLGLSILISDTA